MLHALVPVKSLALAKGRLAPLLAPHERQQLVLAMLADVLAALHATPGVAAVSVLTSDARAADAARSCGAAVRPDHGHGLNGSLAAAAADLAAEGFGRMLVLFADLPLARPAELAALLAHPSPVALAAAADGGTNALAAPLPLGFPLFFGARSLARHQRAARTHGLGVATLHLPGLSFDVDRPEDALRLAAPHHAGAAAAQIRSILVAREPSS